MPPNVHAYLVAWITTSPSEHAASKCMFDEEYHELPEDFLRKSDDQNLYAWGSISGHNVAVVMGRQSRSQVRTPVVDIFAKICASLPEVRLCLLVGTGSGTPIELLNEDGNLKGLEPDIRLGDVVVSASESNGGMIQYAKLRALPGQTRIESKDTLDSAPEPLRTALEQMRKDPAELGPKLSRILADKFEMFPLMAKEYCNPGLAADSKKFDMYYFRGQQPFVRPSRMNPGVHYGIVGSSNLSIQDPSLRDVVLKALEQKTTRPICLENGAAGIAHDLPCLVVRGICDYADSRNADWQRYASMTAAAFAKEVMVWMHPGKPETLARVGRNSTSRNMRKLTNPPSMVGVAAASGHVSFPRHPLHETTLVARHSWNFDTILCTGSSNDLCEVLERHFDDIATGNWLWLTELADLGYDRKDIAEFIVEQREQSPWIYFQPWITSFDMPDPRFHIQRCVHAILESSYGTDFDSSADQTSSDRSSTCDLRRAIASLCGVGGVVPDSPEKRDWIGRLEFLSMNRAAICYRYDDINPSVELARVGRAVARLSTAIAMTQKAKGCCNTFTILCNNSGRSYIELCTISVRDIIHFYNTLQAASIADAQSLQRCKLAAMTTLSCLHPSEEILASVENVSDVVETCLHISALAAQTLCSSFALYAQAHCSPFTPFFLQEDLEEVNLLGVLQNPSEGIYVRAETKRLTCLDAMLNAPVVVYSMSTDAAITKNRLDVLARASDLVDTWGPGAIQGKTKNRQAETITSIDLRGGKIHATGPNRLHWTPFEDLQNAWYVSDWDASDKVVVGALIEHNLSCPITERKCVETIQGCCLPLGTQASYWDQRHREAALQGGQFVTPMFNVGWDKVPGVSLKIKYLEDLRFRREQIAFLNAPCGLQVSFCSGLARRVSMKDLLVELLPLYVNRGLSGSHSWKTLTDVYNILGTLKARDAADCQAMFQRMSAEDNGCFEWFWDQACYIVTSLRSTGLDPTGNTFAVGLISSDASEPMRHVPFKTEASNFWLKALRDTESCATFAFFTLDCFQVDGHGCRRTEQRWHGRILLSQTEVHQQRNGAPTRNAGDKMILQDGKVYPLGGRDIERSIRLCVKVIRPSPSVDPQLLVQRSIIAPSTWKRIVMRHEHFLQERLGPNDDASRAFMTGSHATPFSFN